jgi:hypothetical protein
MLTLIIHMEIQFGNELSGISGYVADVYIQMMDIQFGIELSGISGCVADVYIQMEIQFGNELCGISGCVADVYIQMDIQFGNELCGISGCVADVPKIYLHYIVFTAVKSEQRIFSSCMETRGACVRI